MNKKEYFLKCRSDYEEMLSVLEGIAFEYCKIKNYDIKSIDSISFEGDNVEVIYQSHGCGCCDHSEYASFPFSYTWEEGWQQKLIKEIELQALEAEKAKKEKEKKKKEADARADYNLYLKMKEKYEKSS